MGRRSFLLGLGVSIGTLIIASKTNALDLNMFLNKNDKADFPFKLTDDEWKTRLSPEQYRVLRKSGTERAGTSPLNNEKREGIYHCAGCDHALFSSAHKFESGTGWPSFFDVAGENSVATSTDYKIGYPRTEAHCANCGSHLGHVFKDGPKPTGLRYCMNGVAMTFKQS